MEPAAVETQLMITASGSAYLIDLAEMRLMRVPRRESQLSVDLRRDGEWLKVLHVRQMEVGGPAVFVLEPLGDPAITYATTRVTTDVVWLGRPEDFQG
ncbi:hypothetical protein [Protaetiibacter intestinalis]|uniref:Uncharacterized protein n=1 Tax=Protaetiibacter intestinalis TaxID=2419774 RepID=A0A387B112_9MICO|nr:hypothetical protein [Protaetiibacter intestinalis]AYF97192.1 hypothetical protein D7I47_02300 [Protaetiibacter intestinalis]